MPDKQQQDLLCLVQDCLAKHLYSSAAFFADKLVVLSGCEAAHVYLLAQVGSGACVSENCSAEYASI